MFKYFTSVVIFSLFFSSAALSQNTAKDVDTVKVQLLISTTDTTDSPYLQVPLFVRNGYMLYKKSNDLAEKQIYIIGFLDWFKSPLPKEEKVWQYRKL